MGTPIEGRIKPSPVMVGLHETHKKPRLASLSFLFSKRCDECLEESLETINQTFVVLSRSLSSDPTGTIVLPTCMRLLKKSVRRSLPTAQYWLLEVWEESWRPLAKVPRTRAAWWSELFHTRI